MTCLCAFGIAVSCSVDYRADQAAYERKLCATKPTSCAEGGIESGAGEAGGPSVGGSHAGSSLGGSPHGGGSFGGSSLGGAPQPAAGAGGDEAGGMGGAAGASGVLCSDGNKRCHGGNAEQCANGAWDVTVCDGGTPACELGSCVVCVNGSGSCDDQTPEQCVNHAWAAQAACTGNSLCQTGQCVTPASCTGLAATCGPNGDESCCASIHVPGGDFYRRSDALYPATISDFVLDKYEITVGRFRKFVAAYPGNKPVAGDAARPKIAGSGWQDAWNVNLAVTANVLITNTKCNGYATWTDAAGANENRPINCIDWYTAFAFCSWDGGWLPSDLEWNYAATGGDAQRLYPWGDTPPPYDATHAVYSCYYMGNGTSCSLMSGNIGPVGSTSAGAGLWGHFDLVGNVEEWNLDTDGAFPPTCVDCVNLMGGTRVVHGGYFSAQADALKTTLGGSGVPSQRGSTNGARCGRLP
ncbi:MAG TPA: SUMF1/EgtB/PvdO family nonheme iron enzyme [Polyangiaceae bacterium]|nr:SUMF1/EgtB/PvdO family nonheme iron enzyme [Polyangiaceae bacterium]